MHSLFPLVKLSVFGLDNQKTGKSVLKNETVNFIRMTHNKNGDVIAWLNDKEFIYARSPKSMAWVAFDSSVLIKDSLVKMLQENAIYFADYSYPSTLGGVRQQDFPTGTQVVPAKMVNTGRKQIDCSSFTWAVLNRIYKNHKFTWEHYSKHQYINAEWAGTLVGLQAAVDAGIAEPFVPNMMPSEQGVYLCQYWKVDGGGHSMFVVVDENEGFRLLDSNYDGVNWFEWPINTYPWATTPWFRFPKYKTIGFAKLKEPEL